MNSELDVHGDAWVARLSKAHEDKADATLTADLLRAGLVVVDIRRSPERLIVQCRTARGGAYVAVVERSANEHDHAYARLMTKATIG